MGSFNVLLTLVAPHIVAIVLYRVKHRENLLKPMLTGDKVVDESVLEPKQSSLRLVMVLALVVAAGIYVVVTKL